MQEEWAGSRFRLSEHFCVATQAATRSAGVFACVAMRREDRLISLEEKADSVRSA